MKHTGRHRQGYSMMEVMLVVAIIVILAGVAFVGVVNHLRSMAQLELDGIAKEIFIAGQNHLTMARSQGYFDLDTASEFGVQDPDNSDIYYYVVDPAKPETLALLESNHSALHSILPFASVDETVRLGGSYILRYQKSSGLMLDVFFARPNGRFPYTFANTQTDYKAALDARDTVDGEGNLVSNKALRRSYGTTKAVIGWYGGEEALTLKREDDLLAPTVVIDNGDRLTVTVTNPNTTAFSDGNYPELKLVVIGKTSNEKVEITLVDSDGHITSAAQTYFLAADKPDLVDLAQSSYVLTFDSVTDKNMHFTELFPAFIPGEDISVQAFASSSKVLTTVAVSAEQETNSLFASIDAAGETANIASFRHLENLDASISALDKNDDPISGELNITKANQTTDLDWTPFADNAAKDATGKMHVYNASGTVMTTDAYAPVNPSQYGDAENPAKAIALTYSGAGAGETVYRVSNVVILTDDNAGLFGSLKDGSKVSDLELLNFDVESTGADKAAGALVGDAGNVTLSNVLVRNTLSDDSALEITGKGNVGGLVGKITANGTIDGCGAAVYVKSTNGNAGGLVGLADNAAILNSYAGGHTDNGAYLTTAADNAASRINVRGPVAGGLVGQMSGSSANARYSYSTCSAGRISESAVSQIAGGLVGYYEDAQSIANCYATGYVQGTASGALVGQAKSNSITLSDNRYYRIVNQTGISGVGKIGEKSAEFNTLADGADAVGKVMPLDASYASYAAFVTDATQLSGDESLASPYDSYLVNEYKGYYELQTVNQLNNTTTGRFTQSHYGDWPTPELDALNTKDVSGGSAQPASGLTPVYGPEDEVGDGSATPNPLVPETETVLNENGVQVTGTLPETGVIEAKPVDVTVEGQEVIAAYDIQAYDDPAKKENNESRTKGDPMQVRVEGDFTEGEEIQLYGMADENATPELVTTVTAEDGAVQFDAAVDDGYTVYAVTRILKTTVLASDHQKYEVSVTFDSESGIPDNAVLEVTEILPDPETKEDEVDPYDDYIAQTEEALEKTSDDYDFVLVFDITIRDPQTGLELQPTKPVDVAIRLLEEEAKKSVDSDIVHFDQNTEKPQVLESEIKEEAVEFSSDGFSVYVVMTSLTKTVRAGDGNTYEITVTYDHTAQLPSDAELRVYELVEGTDAYNEYIAKASEALGLLVDTEAYSRLFDITIFGNGDPTKEIEKTQIQPQANVDVSIRLLDAGEADLEDLSLVHFGAQVEEIPATLNENSLDFKASGFSVYGVVKTILVETLTASDGNTYKITVTYDSTSGIPEDAQLIVSEIKEGDEGYQNYVAHSSAKLGKKNEAVSFARAFDITLVNPATGERYQPTKDVQVAIELLSSDISAEDDVHVVHFGQEIEVMDANLHGETVRFAANGFSVYVVIAHEGGEIITPRVEFHFLHYDFTDNNDGTYEAKPYEFPNKSAVNSDKNPNGTYNTANDDLQNSEIVKNGETLEPILNPPNKTYTNSEGTESSKYFYGWYIVAASNVASDETVTYKWTDDPEQVLFEKPVTINPDKIVWANDEHTAITSLVWELNGVEHTVNASDNTGNMVVLDEYGCVHVYLAPIYEDYYFVNFRAGSRGSDLENSILIRRLVILGDDSEVEVRIGDVQASTENAQRQIFTGWEAYLYNEDENQATWQEMSTVDDTGEEMNSGEGKDGYYITITDKDVYPGKPSVDLYPIFTEARWFKFVTGRDHNGAIYVGDKYQYTSDVTAVQNGTAKYFLTDLPTTARTGYTFKGWYANATERDSNGDYIDGIQISDENGQIVTRGDTVYAEDGVTPLYQLKDGRLYVYKDIPDKVTLYAHWEEVTETIMQVIVWKQKISDDKNAYDYQKKYDFERAYTVNTNSGMTLADLRANNKLTVNGTNLEGQSFTGFHYRTTEMSTSKVKGDGTTVVNIYYDRDLMTIYFYYNGSNGEQAYTYTETTSNNTTVDQYGVVEGEYVKLTPVTGSGTKFTFRYDYQRTNSDTILPQYALVAHDSVKLYDELTREVNTVTNTRWSFQTGRGFGKTTRYMDQGLTNGKFYTRGSWNNYEASGYTVDNPPPANDGQTYYCYYNYRYYELTPQSTTTTTYTWKQLNGVEWSGERYYRLAGTEEYTGDRYTVIGDNTNTYGIDTRGGYVQLDGATVPAVTWYATTHKEDYVLNNSASNNGLKKDVYGLVDGEYVKLTPVLGDNFTYETVNTYTQTTAANTAQSEQYGLVDGEYVPLKWEVVETTVAWTITYVYTPTTNTSDGNYYIYRQSNSYPWGYGFQNTQLYYNNGRWYRNRYYSNYYNEWTGGVYNRSTTSSTYSGTVYGLNNSGQLTSDGSGYGDGGNGVIYQLGNQTSTNRYGWAYNGTEYTGNRYLKSAGASWSGDRYTRSGSNAPYTYSKQTANPVVGQVLYAQDGNENGADNYGHVQLNWTVSVMKYTYKDEEGTTHDYSGDRYSLNVVETSTVYTGTRYTRAQNNTFTRMITYTGLYGQTLEQNGYTWPATIGTTDYWWYDGYTTDWRGNLSGQGTRTTFLDAFLFSDGGTVETLYGFTASGTSHIYFYKEALDGSWTLTNDVVTRNGTNGSTFYISDKYNGFTAYQYSTNGTTWTSAGNKAANGYYNNGSGVSYSNDFYIRFKRKSYELTFDPNYPTAAGTVIDGTEVTLQNLATFTANNTVTKSVKYEEALSAYKDQPQPTQKPENYIFSGWYTDSTGTVPYEFDGKMDAANLKLFAKWTPVRFRVMIDPNGGVIDHIDYDSAHNGNYTYQEMGHSETVALSLGDYGSDKTGYNKSQSTFFNVNYDELIGEYEMNERREYVPISDVAAELLPSDQVYYYINTQYIAGYDLEADLRNAVYVIEDELDDYYEFYRTWVQYKADLTLSNPPLDFETWKETYIVKKSDGSGFQKYRHTMGTEHYTFLGWYRLDANGDPEPMPYNFSDPCRAATTLRAYWRLDASYQIYYHVDYETDDGTLINGQIPHLTDPEEASAARYADGATTHIYRQPTGIQANGLPTTEYDFRGWQLVNISTNSQGQLVYTPIENGVYYDPGDDFVVHASYADRSSIIHMQAVYEQIDDSYRRPYITNLTLNANGGFITMDGSTELTENTGLSNTWTGVIGTVAATVTTETGDTELIEFGDIQSGELVQLYRYATDIDHVDGDSSKAALTPAGKNYFKHPDGYFLLGFDNNSNEGDYVATYPADSGIAVQRNEKRTLYAVWEPMVYIKVVNATDKGPVTFGLSSSEGALQVVNARNGLFDRTPMSAAELNAITVEDGDYVWLAVPYGVVKNASGGFDKRHITIEGTNNLGPGWLLSATSTLQGQNRDTLTGSLTNTNADYTSVKNQKDFGFNEILEIDPEGIVITFTAFQNPHTLVLDDNYPTTGVRTQEVYFDKKDNATSLPMGYDIVYGESQTLYYDLPTTSTRTGYIFLGWDENPNWMTEHPNYKTTGDLPTYTTNSTAGWRISSLNSFFAAEPEWESVKTLYAVWDNSAEAKIVYVYKTVPEPGDQNKEFEFTVALSGKYDYTGRNNSYSGTDRDFTAGSAAFSLKNGDYLKIVSEQVVSSTASTYKPSVTTTIQKYNEDDEAQGSPVTLSWEWDNNVSNNNTGNYRSFTFHDLSYTVTEDDKYGSAPHYYDTTLSCTGLADDTYPLTLAGHKVTAVTDPAEEYEGLVLSWDKTEAGGRVVFTNKRQVVDVKVKKVLESNTSVAGVFNFTAAYTLEGHTTDLGSFSVTSATDGYKLEKIPVGATLTVTEVGGNLNDYTTTAVWNSSNNLPVTETEENTDGEKNYKRSVTYSVTKLPDTSITFKNVLKSYPITFYKVDQDGNAGVPSYFRLEASTGLIAEQIYPAQTGTGEFFPGTTGLENKFYVGTYTLTETFVGSDFLPLKGPVTLTLSADDGGKLTSTDPDHVQIEPVDASDLTKGFKVWVYNQKIVKINIEKVLSDPMLNTTRAFLFRVQYEYQLLGKTVTYDNYDTTKPNNGLLSIRSGMHDTINVPVNATLTVTEVLNETDAATYDTEIVRKPATGTADPEVTGIKYVYGTASGSNHGKVVEASNGDTLIFTNTRKKIEVTVKKVVENYDPSAPDDNYFTFTATLLNGGIAITDYPIDLNGTVDDDTDDLKTSSAEGKEGQYVFYLRHNGTKTLSIPIGARLTLQETGVSSTNAYEEDVALADYAAEVKAVYDDDNTEYTEGTYDEGVMLYELTKTPSKDLTVTFSNGPSSTSMVILRKINEDKTALAGATFTIYRSNGTTVVKDGNGNLLENLSSGKNGAFFVGELSYGTYYIKENAAPSGYEGNLNKWFCLIVDEYGTWFSGEGFNDSAKTDDENRAAALSKARQVKAATNP